MKTERHDGPGRLLRAMRAVALGSLGLCASQMVLAQPYYDRSMPSEGMYRYYPEPPRGFRGGQPYECDLYARDNADWYSDQRSGVGRGAVRGAIGGAILGGIVDGGKGARRGALAGGGLGAVAAGAKARQEHERAYRLAYDDCMQRFRR